MLYHIVKPIIRLALLLFCRKVYFNRRDYFREQGPMILAVNHPNSFFDAVIVGVFFKQPVHFLARGDAFKKSWALKILTSLKCIPVYRLREGKEYLHLNEDSFERCRKVLRKKGIVLIFSEGLCINEWNIRPLKKGTARLAFSSWNDPQIGDALRVLPVGVNYNSYRRFGKKVFIGFGEYIRRADAETEANEGANFVQFNRMIAEQLETLCFNHVPNTQPLNRIFSFLINNSRGTDPYRQLKLISNTLVPEEQEWKQLETVSQSYHCALDDKQAKRSLFISILTAIPAFIGWLTAGWFYSVLKNIVRKKNREHGHWDSIVFTALALFYPLYVLLVSLIAGLVTGSWLVFALVFAGMPVCAFFLTVFLPNRARFSNYTRLSSEQRISLQRLTKSLCQ